MNEISYNGRTNCSMYKQTHIFLRIYSLEVHSDLFAGDQPTRPHSYTILNTSLQQQTNSALTLLHFHSSLSLLSPHVIAPSMHFLRLSFRFNKLQFPTNIPSKCRVLRPRLLIGRCFVTC